MNDVRYSLGTYIGIPVTIVILLGLAFVLWMAIRTPAEHEYSDFDRTTRKVVIWASASAIALTLIIFTVSWWPFAWDYHRWTPVKGTVTAIDKRMIGTGESGLGEVYLISFQHTGQQYRCDDTRCAGAHVGESLHLSCIREWQYASLHGYVCRYAGN